MLQTSMLLCIDSGVYWRTQVIAISQDSLGVQAVKLVDNTTMGNMTVKECTGIAASTCTARTVAMYAGIPPYYFLFVV